MKCTGAVTIEEFVWFEASGTDFVDSVGIFDVIADLVIEDASGLDDTNNNAESRPAPIKKILPLWRNADRVPNHMRVALDVIKPGHER